MRSKITIILISLGFLFSFKSSEPQSHTLLEKVYTQTDRPLYFPGETVWFKSYITDAEGKASVISTLLHAELVSPKGNVVSSVLLSIKQGYAYGDFSINENWVGGIYKLRVYTNWMRNFGEDAYFEKELIVQKVISPNLLLKLDFDKEAYGKGAEVTAHFSVKDLKNVPLAQSSIAYDVSIGGQKVQTEQLTTDAGGKSDLTFTLPAGLNTADVLLNVRVSYKGSQEAISRSVPVVLNKVDLQFMPESGHAVRGTDNLIAFKALNEFGKPADVSGDIVNAKNEVVANFSSYHDGMGGFTLHPEETQYYARITAPFLSDSLIALPQVLKEGTRFSVDEDDQNYSLEVFSNQYNQLYIEVTGAHHQVFNGLVNLQHNKGSYQLSKKELPVGILKITLKNNHGNVVAERLLFANKPNQLQVSVSLNKSYYKTREKVEVAIKTTDASGKPIPANLSVSVADNKLVTLADDKQDNILSYLLMSSELQGKIHKPQFYFDPKENDADKALDYVMLTHGWRDYVTAPISFESATYTPDTRSTQYGVVVNEKGLGVKSKLLLFDKSTDKVLAFETNDQGLFTFETSKTGQVVLMAYTDTDEVLWIRRGSYVVPGDNGNLQPELTKEEVDFKGVGLEKPLEGEVKEKVTEVAGAADIDVALELNSAELDEVIVVGYGTTTKEAYTGSVIQVYKQSLLQAGDEDVVGVLQGQAAGVQVARGDGIPGAQNNIQIRGVGSISGNSQPLFVIDGVLYDGNASQGIYGTLDANQIESITILKGSSAAAIYGSNGANGVIVITSKDGHGYRANWGRKKFGKKKERNYVIQEFYTQGPATYQSRKFYMPVYSGKEAEDRADFRSTLYWNPVVQTDANGEAHFEFYNSDAVSSFVITTEGIGYNGLPGRNVTEYATRKPLSIEIKTPNYMAVNDTINIPVTITNETDEVMNTTLKVRLPEYLKAIEGSEDRQLSVPANAYGVMYVKVVPVATAKHTSISIVAEGKGYSDSVDKPVSIISSYFPTSASVSGTKDGSYTFNINHVVPGTLKAELVVYTDVVGTVMDGIEGIIRQPYGCFEQVSSSTYPNVMVLKYLKETHKSKPEIESRAMNYIIDGYKKLAGYETREDGFEWFGHTPPHEALTAYGLLEFTEMKAVYSGVDEKMLNRTVNYLLSRKNGDGFRQNEGKYDHFGAATKDVTDAYIVYALSEAGITNSYESEYKSIYNKVYKSNDMYRMALLACTAYNLDKTEDAQEMMKKIHANIAQFGFDKLPAENTVTHSYGQNKQTETAALTLLALLKEGDEVAVTQGLEYIFSKRQFGTFGATQATVLSLKAIIEYTKTQKAKMLKQGDAFELTLNGHKISKSLLLNEAGKITIDRIERYMTPGKQQVKVHFTNKEVTFPYQFNVQWDATMPSSSPDCRVAIETHIAQPMSSVGETVRLNVQVRNTTTETLPMVTAIVGIPCGTQAQPWQLKEIAEQQKADYVEVFDNYLVFYWKGFDVSETKTIGLDLKAEVPGAYTAPASTAYLYYTDDQKHWVKGEELIISN